MVKMSQVGKGSVESVVVADVVHARVIIVVVDLKVIASELVEASTPGIHEEVGDCGKLQVELLSNCDLQRFVIT